MDIPMTKEALKRASAYVHQELKQAGLGGDALGVVFHDFLDKGAELLKVLSESDDIEKNGQAIGGVLYHLYAGLQSIEAELENANHQSGVENAKKAPEAVSETK